MSSAHVRHGRSMVLFPRGSYGAHDVTCTPSSSHTVAFSPAIRFGALSAWKCVRAHWQYVRAHAKKSLVHFAVSGPLLVCFR